MTLQHSLRLLQQDRSLENPSAQINTLTELRKEPFILDKNVPHLCFIRHGLGVSACQRREKAEQQLASSYVFIRDREVVGTVCLHPARIVGNSWLNIMDTVLFRADQQRLLELDNVLCDLAGRLEDWLVGLLTPLFLEFLQIRCEHCNPLFDLDVLEVSVLEKQLSCSHVMVPNFTKTCNIIRSTGEPSLVEMHHPSRVNSAEHWLWIREDPTTEERTVESLLSVRALQWPRDALDVRIELIVGGTSSGDILSKADNVFSA